MTLTIINSENGQTTETEVFGMNDLHDQTMIALSEGNTVFIDEEEA